MSIMEKWRKEQMLQFERLSIKSIGIQHNILFKRGRLTMNKKKNREIIVLEILLMTLITGCTKVNDVTQVSQNNEVLEQTSDIDKLNGLTSSFGWGDDVKLYPDDNDNISEQIILSTSEPNVDMGVICFVDGYLQPVSVNGDKEQTVNIITTGKDVNYDISFDIVSARAGQKVRVDMISLLNPSYEITENTVDEGLSFRSSSPIAQTFDATNTVEMNEYTLIDNKKDISGEFKAKNGISDNNNPFSSKAYFRFERENEDNKWVQIKDNRINIRLDIMGGSYSQYNIYVFADNKVIKAFEGYECAKVTVDNNKISVLDVSADISDMDISEYSVLYAVAVPDGEYTDNIISPLISDRLFLKK